MMNCEHKKDPRMKGPSFLAATRTRIGVRLVCAILLFLALPALAQSERGNTRSSQAVLHIRINIVPVILSSQPAREPSAGGLIAYHIPLDSAKTSVTVDVRPLPAASGRVGVLKTTTIVAR